MFERFCVSNIALVMNMIYVENNSEKLFIFQSGDNSILNIDQKNIMEIPIFDCNTYGNSNLFVLYNEKYKKFFNNISRKVVESTELIVR